MLYPYPPIQWNDPDSGIWIGIISAGWVMSIGFVIAAVTYFRRAYQGKPSTPMMLGGFLVAGLIEIPLTLLIAFGGRNPDQSTHAVSSIPALISVLLVLVHCSLALSTRNVDVRQQAQVILQCLMALGCVTILALMSLPAERHAREPARRTQCKNNLKQIGLAHHNFHDTFLHFATPNSRESDGPAYSWRVSLLPFVDQAPLYSRYDRTRAWDSAENLGFASERLSIYTCPSLPPELHRNAAGQAYTAYAMVTGMRTVTPNGKALKISEITDGTSTTILVVEACGQQIVWTRPQDIELTVENTGVNLPGSQPNYSAGVLSSYHKGGSHVLLADGSVRFIGEKIDPTVLNALLTATGKETVGDF